MTFRSGEVLPSPSVAYHHLIAFISAARLAMYAATNPAISKAVGFLGFLPFIITPFLI